jgi:hypothetical protein
MKLKYWLVVTNQSVADIMSFIPPEKFTDKYITAWKNFGVDIIDIGA